MIVRIVKMTFEPSRVKDFLEIFDASKELIRSFEGCSHLKLLNDINTPGIFFTYSVWESEAHLDAYRNSGLFRSTWSRTKVLFAAKPEAWSVNSVRELP
jgi:heme oxygenase (mycobilin-producing)